MLPRNAPPPAASDEIAQLRDEVADLKNEVRVLSDILDEIREELQWVTRNGLPIRQPLPACPTLKRMAADPCADDWNERLVIEYGDAAKRPTSSTSDVTSHPEQPLAASSGKPPAGKLFVESGEQRRLF